MNIFIYTDYRQFIKDSVSLKKKLDAHFTYGHLAKITGIQNTYLSNCLAARAQLSSEQLYKIGSELGLKGEEIDFFLLLGELDRSSDPSYKKRIEKQIKKIKQNKIHIKEFTKNKVIHLSDIDQAEYYLDPFIQIVHVFLGISKYRHHPDAIIQALGISKQHFAQLMQVLVKLGFITLKNEKIILNKANFHLAKESPICLPHQMMMRLKSIDQIQKVEKGERQTVSICFSTDSKTFDEIRESFFQFLKKVESKVKASSGRKAYQLNFDLFPWNLK